MAYENPITYTEVDPNSHLTLTSEKVTAASIHQGEDAYVYKDFGVDFFGGNFEHLLEVSITDEGAVIGRYYTHSLTNIIDDWKGIGSASGDGFGIYSSTSSGIPFIFLNELDGGASYEDFTGTITVDTPYYLAFYRDLDVGTYGTLYCEVYSDSSRTTLVNTLSVTLHSSIKKFRYCFMSQSYNIGNSALKLSGYINQLDLQLDGTKITGGDTQGFYIPGLNLMSVERS